MKAIAILALLALPAFGQQFGDDPSARCFDALDLEAELQPLRGKVGSLSRPTSAGIDVLTDRARASEAERPMIREWAKLRQNCFDRGTEYRARSAPPGYQEQMTNANTLLTALIARLYLGELSYGEFAAERARLAADNTARLTAIFNAAARAAQDHDRHAQEVMRAAHEANVRDRAEREARLARDNASTLQILQMLQPKPKVGVICDSYRVGNRVETICR